MRIIYKRGQTGTRESILSNAGDAIGNFNRSQTAAILESPISNAGDAVRYGIVGYRGGNNNVTGVLATILRRNFSRLAGGIEVVIQIADLDSFVIPGEHGSYAGCYSKQ